MDIERSVITKLEPLPSGEAAGEHVLRLLIKQLEWSLQEMKQNCGDGSEEAKLARLLFAFHRDAPEEEQVFDSLDAYWQWFLYYSPRSKYHREGGGAINQLGGDPNEGWQTAVIEQAQMHLARLTTALADSVGMALWLAGERRQETYAEAAVEEIIASSLDYYERTSPQLDYYGRLGDDENFRETDMGVRLVGVHNFLNGSLTSFKTPALPAEEAAGLVRLTAEAAVRGLCAQITYARRWRQADKLVAGLDHPDDTFPWERSAN